MAESPSQVIQRGTNVVGPHRFGVLLGEPRLGIRELGRGRRHRDAISQVGASIAEREELVLSRSARPSVAKVSEVPVKATCNRRRHPSGSSGSRMSKSRVCRSVTPSSASAEPPTTMASKCNERSANQASKASMVGARSNLS